MEHSRTPTIQDIATLIADYKIEIHKHDDEFYLSSDTKSYWKGERDTYEKVITDLQGLINYERIKNE